MNVHKINNSDGVVAHGNAISAAGWFFDSVSDEALSTLDLSKWSVIMWNAGEESTEDTVLTAEHQDQLRSYLYDGGKLWITGSEVLWDLDALGSSEDISFAKNILGVRLGDDDAGTQWVNGQALLDGLSLDFDLDAGAPYPVEYPDVLITNHTVVATYATGGVAAAVGDDVAVFGFPFECIGDAAVRPLVVQRILGEWIPKSQTDTELDTDGETQADVDDPSSDPEGYGPPESVPVEPHSRRCGCAAQPAALRTTLSWLVIAFLMGILRQVR